MSSPSSLSGGTVAEVERQLILATVEHCGGTREKAAEILGISLKTLYNRFREYEADSNSSIYDDTSLAHQIHFQARPR
jgi:DNA-binding NtrC family response regulator